MAGPRHAMRRGRLRPSLGSPRSHSFCPGLLIPSRSLFPCLVDFWRLRLPSRLASSFLGRAFHLLWFAPIAGAFALGRPHRFPSPLPIESLIIAENWARAAAFFAPQLPFSSRFCHCFCHAW